MADTKKHEVCVNLPNGRSYVIEPIDDYQVGDDAAARLLERGL